MDVVDTIKELSSRLLADILELDVDEGNKMRQPLEGQLYKYTNVVKGWQYRWFVLNPDIGMLEYYMLDEVKKGKPRGAVHLAGAVISPSDEDGQMFTVSAACGEVYKLRGQDAKERQFWINRLRKVAEDHTKTIAQLGTQKYENCSTAHSTSRAHTFAPTSIDATIAVYVRPDDDDSNKTFFFTENSFFFANASVGNCVGT